MPISIGKPRVLGAVRELAPVVLERLKRLVNRNVPEPGPEPLTPRERARLEHAARRLERRRRALAKRIGDGCSTCVQQSPGPALTAATKQLRAIEAELGRIHDRLE